MYEALVGLHTSYRCIGDIGRRAAVRGRVPRRVPVGSRPTAPEQIVCSVTEGVGTRVLAGFFSGPEAQSEIDDMLDMLYGSYGVRLMVG